MPARRDLDPEDIVPLLPHLIISERVNDKFSYKLLGTGVRDDLGYDPTGYFAGEYLDAGFYPEIQATFGIVYAHGAPVFATGESRLKWLLHAWSSLILPLADNDRTVNRTISSFVQRLHPDQSARHWLEHQAAKVLQVTAVQNAEELEKLCLQWDERTKPKP